MDLASSPVADVMRNDFTVLHPDDRIDAVDPIDADLLAIRHLVVLDARGRVVGIVSLRDLLEEFMARLRIPNAEGAEPGSMTVSDLMSRPVETIRPGEILAAAANRMISHRISCLPVVRDDGVMVGLVTDADLLEAACRVPRPPDSESISGSSSSSRK